MAKLQSSQLSYQGCNFFRQRLILSTLSCRPVEIKNIRSNDEEPGLRDFEVNFLKLLDSATNGTVIEVNETGTSLLYKPGLLSGGKFEHQCSTDRSIGYYLECLIALAPFCKKPFDVTLRGVTNNATDPSVDSVKHSSFPVFGRFMFTEGLDLEIVGRGVPPLGGGEVRFRAPICRALRPVQLLKVGKVKRVRGWAYAVRVSPAMASRIVEAAKGVLLDFLPDVYIYADHHKGKRSGNSPGFGVCLVAETTEGAFLCAEAASDGPSVPEDIGVQGARALLREIYKGGCVDSTNQSLACLFMALGPADVSKCLMGPPTPYTIQFLRHLRDFFNVTFKVERQEDKVKLTCVGTGFINLSKTTT
ncbi:RNA 3'-terminal phosphate cyclase-like protein [Ornithodoros turicata]|uniref:RNA 3'-terminal phosphate cyclase-like protein n=1 Tax=Ornithodoros turicata TaxID=34597 RepID=UPI003138B6CF